MTFVGPKGGGMYCQDTSLQVLLIFYLDSTQPNFTPKMEGIFLDLGAESSFKFFARLFQK